MSAAAKPAPSLWQGLRVALDALEEADADATLVADALALAAYVQTHGEEVGDILGASGWVAPPSLRETAAPAHREPFHFSTLRYLRRIVDAFGGFYGLRLTASAYYRSDPTVTAEPSATYPLPPERRADVGQFTDVVEQMQRDVATGLGLPMWAVHGEPGPRIMLDDGGLRLYEHNAPSSSDTPPSPVLSFDLRGLDQMRDAFARLGHRMGEAARHATSETAREVAAEARRAWPGYGRPRLTRHAERARGRALQWRRLGEVEQALAALTAEAQANGEYDDGGER